MFFKLTVFQILGLSKSHQKNTKLHWAKNTRHTAAWISLYSPAYPIWEENKTIFFQTVKFSNKSKHSFCVEQEFLNHLSSLTASRISWQLWPLPQKNGHTWDPWELPRSTCLSEASWSPGSIRSSITGTISICICLYLPHSYSHYTICTGDPPTWKKIILAHPYPPPTKSYLLSLSF